MRDQAEVAAAVTEAVCRDYRRIRQTFDRTNTAAVRKWVNEILDQYADNRERVTVRR